MKEESEVEGTKNQTDNEGVGNRLRIHHTQNFRKLSTVTTDFTVTSGSLVLTLFMVGDTSGSPLSVRPVLCMDVIKFLFQMKSRDYGRSV